MVIHASRQDEPGFPGVPGRPWYLLAVLRRPCQLVATSVGRGSAGDAHRLVRHVAHGRAGASTAHVSRPRQPSTCHPRPAMPPLPDRGLGPSRSGGVRVALGDPGRAKAPALRCLSSVGVRPNRFRAMCDPRPATSFHSRPAARTSPPTCEPCACRAIEGGRRERPNTHSVEAIVARAPPGYHQALA